MIFICFSVDTIFPMVMTCSEDDEKVVSSLGLTLPHSVCDSGQGGYPELTQQGKEELTFSCQWELLELFPVLGLLPSCHTHYLCTSLATVSCLLGSAPLT